jgi:hypothetical protein
MSYHKFSYYDYRKNKIGELLITVIAPSILEADKLVEDKYQIKIDKSPFIGCQIDFDHCHTSECPKESYTVNSCECGFTKRHIEKYKYNQYIKSAYTPMYKIDPLPAEQTKLVDLTAILKETKERAAALVWTDEEDQ